MLISLKLINYYIFWNSHSLLSKGHTFLVFNHFVIQWKWNVWLHTPHATWQSIGLFPSCNDWHSIQGSCTWFLQIAQVSIWISKGYYLLFTPCPQCNSVPFFYLEYWLWFRFCFHCNYFIYLIFKILVIINIICSEIIIILYTLFQSFPKWANKGKWIKV